MLEKIGLYFRTIKHLKPIQTRYRLWYMMRSKLRKITGHSYPLSIYKESHRVKLTAGISKSPTFNLQPSTFNFESVNQFTFLNRSQIFKENIDWNFSEHGKLWAYNLNYFDYLHQEDITEEQGLELIRELIDQLHKNEEGLEPYPISLRGINWIKFLRKYDINDKEIDSSLYAQYQILLDNIEYHLMGNHLLENGCSLLFGGYYFQDRELYDTAIQIISEQLKEQILSDGGHFERSTMYHCILLERLLDCYNLVVSNNWLRSLKFKEKLRNTIELMMGWAEKVACYRLEVDGLKLPLLNDASRNFKPNYLELVDYADYLNLKPAEVELSESGYRKYSTGVLEIVCDAGNIGPDYIPGHAHSDTLSFVLYCDGRPVIIDPGISTYENNSRRQLERSTEFHNTVQLGDKEQSEVWSAFRVGRRAKVSEVKEIHSKKNIQLSAVHDGYRKWGVMHKRKWDINRERNHIMIEDTLANKSEKQAKLYLHFDPCWNDKIKFDDKTIQFGKMEISFETDYPVRCYTYDCPNGYNKYIKATKVEVPFKHQLVTDIRFT